MAVFFEGNRGRVVRMNDPAAQASVGYIQVADSPIMYDTHWSIITRLTLSHQANVQFLHTLGSAIYIYVFGDRIGQMGLSGLSFNSACESGERLGIEQMMDWYRENRVSQKGAPVRVMIGNTAIEGFVVGSSEDTVDAETGLVQWGVNLQTLPEA